MNSEYFHVLTGVRVGGVLSPYLFRFYVRDIIQFTRMNVGCSVGGSMIHSCNSLNYITYVETKQIR